MLFVIVSSLRRVRRRFFKKEIKGIFKVLAVAHGIPLNVVLHLIGVIAVKLTVSNFVVALTSIKEDPNPLLPLLPQDLEVVVALLAHLLF